MPFSDEQLMQAIEQGLCRTRGGNALQVVDIMCEDVVWYGMSANTFARCAARIMVGGTEQQVELVIKRWAPGGPVDIEMGLAPLPREAWAFAAGIFDSDVMPPGIDAQFIAALDDPG